MPAISSLTHAKIVAYLEVFIENLVEDYRGRVVQSMEDARQYLSLTDTGGGLKPFHAALALPEVLRISAFERGLVTRLGTTLEECARLIALDHHPVAARGHEVRGQVSAEALAEIERQVAQFEHAASGAMKRPTLNSMIERVIRANETGERFTRDKKADLHVKGRDGVEFYFELKSPKPNKDQCLRNTQSILLIHALRDNPRPQVRSYLALPYNPYGSSRRHYAWSVTRNYMPFDDAVLIGDEFWRLLGGATAYRELLDIYRYVGRVKGKFIAESLAFGL